MKYQEEIIYLERKIALAEYYGHKLKALYYKWKLKKLKRRNEMDSLLNFGATVIVAIIGLVGIVIQTKSKEKQESISKKIDALRIESKNGDTTLSNKLDESKMQMLKVWLTTELTKIRDGLYKPNEEEKRLLFEVKKEYNNLGGDSYVDDMFDDIKSKNII